MRLDEDAVREVLADAWERWACRCAAVTDAAEMLRSFNAPGGIAHTLADDLAEQATSDASQLTPDDAVTRFTECAEILCATPMSNETVITYPVVGSTALAVVAEVALMEATVHLLDLADAVGGVQPTEKALAGRADPAAAVRPSGDSRHTIHSELSAGNGIKLASLRYFYLGAAWRPPISAIC